MLEAKTKLPCGVHKFLVREEYDLVYDVLTQVESGEWWNVCSDDENETEELSRIGYQVSGRPAIDIFPFLPLGTEAPEQAANGGARVTADYLYNLTEDKKRELWILTDELIRSPCLH
ncbi:hypothetical protein HOY82DRAFT_603791 [Tuber indicum]|nr:hypothetical protein HOY82DRAFT_603791 [Tuber indicum]